MTEMHGWEKEKLKSLGLDSAPAQFATLPGGSGDGYSFGGGSLITIGQFAVLVGEGDGAYVLAKELARRWNEGI